VPGGDLVSRQTTFTVPAGFYTPQGLAEKVTSASSGIINTNGSGGQLASPFSILVNSATDIGKFWLESSEAFGMVGAVLDYHNNGGAFNLSIFGSPSGLVMRWDDNIGRMELAYGHNPMQDATGSEATRRLATYTNGTQVTDAFTFFGDRSGVCLTDVGFGNAGQPDWESPNNIFNVLGFSFKDLLLTGNWQRVQNDSILPANYPSFTSTLTTANLMPMSSDSPGSRSGLVTPSAPEFISSPGQRGRQASNGPRSYGTESPVILVECDILPEPTMICSDGRRRRIVGYVTKELESGGFIYTSLSAEAVFSRTTAISSVTVRLLDSSKDFRVVTGLGLASELILEFQLAEVPEASPGAAKKRRQRRRKSQWP
jgi:hypothetical protein